MINKNAYDTSEWSWENVHSEIPFCKTNTCICLQTNPNIHQSMTKLWHTHQMVYQIQSSRERTKFSPLKKGSTDTRCSMDEP